MISISQMEEYIEPYCYQSILNINYLTPFTISNYFYPQNGIVCCYPAYNNQKDRIPFGYIYRTKG